MDPQDAALLTVAGLTKRFPITDAWLARNRSYVNAVDGVDLTVGEGETFGIVGESGCGKSTLGNMIMNLIQPTTGRIVFDGDDLSQLTGEEMRLKRRHMQMIFQDPFSSLNPRMRIFDTVAEPLRAHKIAAGDELRRRVFELLDVVGLNSDHAKRWPHEFSGGQRQRIVIARALALKPKLIICDEPVSALDVSIQAQILNLLVKLQREFNLTYIFVAHGLPAVKYISDRIAVMYLGKIVELAPKESLFSEPLHPYTESLIRAVPIPDPSYRRPVVSMEQKTPASEATSYINTDVGCKFASRCRLVAEICRKKAPILKEHHPGHFVSCHHPVEYTIT